MFSYKGIDHISRQYKTRLVSYSRVLTLANKGMDSRLQNALYIIFSKHT